MSQGGVCPLCALSVQMGSEMFQQNLSMILFTYTFDHYLLTYSAFANLLTH